MFYSIGPCSRLHPSGTVVENTTYNSKVEGSYPAADNMRGKTGKNYPGACAIKLVGC